MQAPDRPKIQLETLQALLNAASDPRRLGGCTRAKAIIGRRIGRTIGSYKDLQDILSSMLEEDAAALLNELGARMPDLAMNSVFTAVRRLYAA